MTKPKTGTKDWEPSDKLIDLWLEQVHAKVAVEAKEAFYRGDNMEQCPYPKGSMARTWWLDVWHHEGYIGCGRPFGGIHSDRRWVNKGSKGDS